MSDKEEKILKIICDAISNRRLIQFKYKKLTKVVEPYLIGTHKKTGNIVLRAYSVSGQSKSPSVFGWKFYILEIIEDLVIREDDFNIRIGYKQKDSDVSRIIFSI